MKALLELGAQTGARVWVAPEPVGLSPQKAARSKAGSPRWE